MSVSMGELVDLRIQKLNDTARQEIGVPIKTVPCETFFTAGVAKLFKNQLPWVVQAVATFNQFNEDNDPYQEHDWGSFLYSGHKLNWKIDYYTPDKSAGSAEPADIGKTLRVLTIMLVEES